MSLKIKSVRKIRTPVNIPVYDIEVPGTSNFVLSCGIVVHNSKDLTDAVAASTFKASQMMARDSAYDIQGYLNAAGPSHIDPYAEEYYDIFRNRSATINII